MNENEFNMSDIKHSCAKKLEQVDIFYTVTKENVTLIYIHIFMYLYRCITIFKTQKCFEVF